MRAKTITFALFGLLSFHQLVQAQDTKIRISVSHSGEDSVGKQFAYAIREAIRASSGFRLVPTGESGAQINLVTIDPERASNSGNYWTAAAVTYTMTNFLPLQKGNPQTWYPIYLTSQVLTVGTSRTDQQAKAVMATLDEALEQYRHDAKN